MLYVGNIIPKQVTVGGAMLRLCSTGHVLSGHLTGPQKRRDKAGLSKPAPTFTTTASFGAQRNTLALLPAAHHGRKSDEVTACSM